MLLLSLVFPEAMPYLMAVALVFEFLKRYQKNLEKKKIDGLSLELLFSLSSKKDLTEKAVAFEMRKLGLKSYSEIFDRKSKLILPRVGWKSKIASSAIMSYLETGNHSILLNAISLISRQEEYSLEANSLIASQKYTLMASLAVASAVLGIVSQMTEESYLWYVLMQSVISGIWLGFFETESRGVGSFYESLAFSVPASVLAYLLSVRFV